MQFKQVLSVLCLCVMVMMTGCVMPAKTKVTKDGFTARQKTTEAHRAIVEDYDVYRPDCRWDQRMQDKNGDGEWYCPPDATKEGYNSHVQLAQYMESVLDKWGPKTLQAAGMLGAGALIMHGLQTQAVSPAAQSFPDARISTFNTFGQAPVGFVR